MHRTRYLQEQFSGTWRGRPGEGRGAKATDSGKMLAYFAQLQSCRIGLEACGEAHYWAQELGKLGHEVQLMAVPIIQPAPLRESED